MSNAKIGVVVGDTHRASEPQEELASSGQSSSEQTEEPPSSSSIPSNQTSNQSVFSQNASTPDSSARSEVSSSRGSKGKKSRPRLSGVVALDSRRPKLRVSRTSAATAQFRKTFYPDVEDKSWNDWRWQSQNRVRTLAQLDRLLLLTENEREAIVKGGTMLPLGVTPYYMSLLSYDNAEHGLRRTVIPSVEEFNKSPVEADDPLGEDLYTPVPGLVHRYPDRVLLLAHDFCSTYCRYCTRSRVVGHGEIHMKEERLQKIFDYLTAAPQVRDVLISGGDALALSDEKLFWLLSKLKEIPHLEFIRIGTKMPAVLPQRITPQLCRMLRKVGPVWMSIHFTHPEECTPEARVACAKLADAGVPLGSQTVLLKGVNDDELVLKDMFHKLLTMRVRPYYLYQCDPISGSSHFRTSISKGLEIIESLRGHTTGYAVPTFVVDAPGGGGKIPLQPNYLVGREADSIVLRNYEGKHFTYPDESDFLR